jgi:hypothetical protein
MVPRLLVIIGLLWTAEGWVGPARAEEPLDPDTIKAVLRTTVVEDDNYTLFLTTLANQGRLSRDLVNSSLEWARKKATNKYQYFKQAVIAQADHVGIALPPDTPPLRRDVHGRVVQRIVLIDVPVPYVSVEVLGTKIKTRTNIKGEFTLPQLPWGVFKVEVHGGAAQLFRTLAHHLSLPFLPADKTTLTFRFH